jgi:hypothetical protein
VAVEAGLLNLIRRILKFNDSPINDKKLLGWVKDYKKREILMILAELRPGDMDEGVLSYAIKHKDQDLFKALKNAKPCRCLFDRPGLLRDLIMTGQATILSDLLEDFPHLALQLDEEDKPLLVHTDDDTIRAKVVDLIIRKASSTDRSLYRSLLGHDDSQPVQNAPMPPISEVIRALIADPPGMCSLIFPVEMRS